MKNSVKAAAVAKPFATNAPSALPDGISSWLRAAPNSVTPVDAPIAVHAAAVSASVRGTTRSLSSAYAENITIDPHTSSTPVVVIATSPPPTATIALPEIDSTSATSVRARSRIAPVTVSTSAITAGYA